MKKTIITGAKGIIGSSLMKGLRGCDIMPVDLPEFDLRDYEKTADIFAGKDAVIHLAWNTGTENFASKRIDPDNTLIFKNAIKAALENDVNRFIFASSVHAGNFLGWKGKGFIGVNKKPAPNSPYGKHKVMLENLGREYSKRGMEVVCIRFGCVCPLERPYWKDIKVVGLSHPDCASLVKACLEAGSVPDNFAVVNGVSENKLRIHDYSNPFGWKPDTDAVEFYRRFEK